MNELNVRVTQEVGTIEFNYEEIKSNLTETMALYKDAVFEDDSMKIAKAEMATLRKIKAAIDEKRKTVKKECLKPYEDFEKKANELMGLVDKPILLIDTQVKNYVEKEKQKKKAEIQNIYNELIGDMAEYLPLEKIYNPKWENATTKPKAIREEIEQAVSNTKAAIDSLKTMGSEAVPEAINIYKQTLNLASAIDYINKYERQRAEILARELEKQKAEEERKAREREWRIREEERKRVAEEDRIRQEEREKIEKANVQKIAEPDPIPIIEEPFEQEEPEDINIDLPFVQPSTIRAIYTVVATPGELEEVETIFNSVGIYFSREDAIF